MKAAELIEKGAFGKMAALRGDDIVPIPLKDAVAKLRTVDPKLYEQMKVFFG